MQEFPGRRGFVFAGGASLSPLGAHGSGWSSAPASWAGGRRCGVDPQHRHQVKYLMDIFNICCEIASGSTLALV